MKQKRKGVIKLLLAMLCVMGVFLGMPVDEVQAGTLFESPYVHFTPDGFAWTVSEGLPYTDYYYKYNASGTSPEYWYANGTRVETGIASSLRGLNVGEHYYLRERMGEVPIKYWEVLYPNGKCIHDCEEESWHGVPNNPKKCHSAYYSGWFAYCADCEEQLSVALVYMSKNAAASITSLNMDYGYYYVCPTNGHIENTYGELSHDCKAISFNKYRVAYNVNTDGLFTGEMQDSFHMYNNETVYRGQSITPITRLSQNTYRRTGYTFVGWNTKPNGSGISYADGAEILNLSTYDCNEDPERGTVTLYAQWVPSNSTLRIDPAGGSYNGNSGITVLNKGYGNTYLADPSKIACPSSFKVSFNTAGGNAIADKRATTHFSAWVLSSPFHGRFRDNMYAFLGNNGDVDTLTASYEADPIILPTPTRPGYSFGGWFEDSACTKPVGFGGEEYSPKRDTTLFAKWVELVLWSYDNYTANNRKGAVDLKWSQPDTNAKNYKLYVSEDSSRFNLLYGANETVTMNNTEKSFAYRNASETYTVPYSGFYNITAYGAQGDAYSSNAGGKGGKVTAKIYLTAGEILTVTVGGQNGYNGGGSATKYGNGGGATTVKSNVKGTLLIAGGGGGGSIAGNGGDGGSTSSNVNASTGERGPAGGGGGYQGGTAGTYETHTHVDACWHKHVDACYGYVYCGGTSFKDDSHHAKSYRCDRDWSGNVIYGDRCGGSCNSYCSHDGKTGHCVWENKYTCQVCGTEYTNNPTVCTSNGRYDLVCGKDGVAVCGYTENEIISSSIAYGGSSYVNTSYAVSSQKKAGEKSGNGSASISAESVGFMDALTLNGVAAPDKAAPNAIDEESVSKMGAGDKAVLVSFDEPDDNGTQYWYKAESYIQGTETLLCTSNVTTNILTTGVAGYYYILDTSPTKTVTASNAQNRTAILTTTSIRVLLTHNKEYLHIAPVDVAGNVGPTLNIELNLMDMESEVTTDQIAVSSVVNGVDYKSIYSAGAKSYYVRADGTTPFMMSFKSYLQGEARLNYQVDYQIFDSRISATGAEQQYITKLPYSSPLSNTGALNVAEFVRQAAGDAVLTDAANTGASRSRDARDNKFYQAFVIKRALHGKTIQVTPVAGATYGDEVGYSVWSNDITHGVTLIADGEAPLVSGTDILESLDVINRNDGSIVLNLSASDDLSGVREFSVVVTNTDSGSSREFYPDASGNIVLDITANDSLFNGSITIEINAVDNVGNATELTYGAIEFELKASIVNARDHSTNVCRRGESALLHIATYGYADKVVVDLPEELKAGNESLQLVYNYSSPDYIMEENLLFAIPLYAEIKPYTVTVHAYRDGRELVATPMLLTIDGGSVLDDIKVRIR